MRLRSSFCERTMPQRGNDRAAAWRDL